MIEIGHVMQSRSAEAQIVFVDLQCAGVEIAGEIVETIPVVPFDRQTFRDGQRFARQIAAVHVLAQPDADDVSLEVSESASKRQAEWRATRDEASMNEIEPMAGGVAGHAAADVLLGDR